MSIELKTLLTDGRGVDAKLIVIDSQEDWLDFKELVFRAMNLWPDAPASLKRFSDMVQHGKVLQDYKDSTTRHKLFPQTTKEETNGN